MLDDAHLLGPGRRWFAHLSSRRWRVARMTLTANRKANVHLTPRLRAKLEASRSADDIEGKPLDLVVRDFVNRAVGAWPQVRISPEDFLEHVAQQLPSDPSVNTSLHNTHSDLLLAYGCLKRAPQALVAFEKLLGQVTRRVVSGLGLSPDEVEELKQGMMELFVLGDGRRRPRLEKYCGKGSLAAWLRTVVSREARCYATGPRRARDLEETLLTALLTAHHDPELSFLKVHDRQAFKTAFQAALADLDDGTRDLIRHLFFDGLKLNQLAQVYKVDATTIARRMKKAQERLLRSTKERMSSELRMTPDEVDSLLNAIQSRLDVSLSRVLGERT